MKKLLFTVLMAIMVIPMMQAFDRPGQLNAMRNSGKVTGIEFKNHDFGKLTNKAMLKGENAITWDFEDEAQMDDWMALDNDGDNYGWGYKYNGESDRLTTHSGEGCIFSESYSNEVGVLTPDNWLISPVVNLGGTLRLWACGQDKTYFHELFAIYVCVGDPTNINDFVAVSADVETTSEMVEYKFDLGAFAGQTGCFAIVHHNVSDQFILVVDDITIDPDEVYVPDPTTPVNVNVTPYDVEADVEWTDNDDAAWNLRYREYNPNASQTIHWSAEPNEDFSDWMIYNADGDDYSWSTIDLSPSAPDGDYVFYSASYASGALDPDEYLITPEVKIDGTLTFWAGTYYYPEYFAVYLITDVNDPDTWVEIMGKTEAVDGYYQGAGEYYTIDLTPYADMRGNGRIAFRHFDSYNQYYFFLDDITIEIPGEPEYEWIYVNGLDEPYYTIEGLTPETTYEVQVQAYNAEKESDWTESTIFTTLEPATPDPVYNITTGKYNEKYVEITCEDEDATIYYRIQFENGNWSEWTEYDGKMMFVENGEYNIEAYAVAPDMPASGTVPEQFTVSGCTAVNEVNSDKAVAGVRYYNVAGQEMAQPEGMTIVVTTYTDGTTVATKVVK